MKEIKPIVVDIEKEYKRYITRTKMNVIGLNSNG
jgi:hypothetical protein